MKTLRALGAAAAIASLVLLAGCSGASNTSQAASGAGAGAPEQGGTNQVTDAKAPAAGPSAAPAEVPVNTADQKLARTARVNITVTDVEAAASQLRTLAFSLDGQITAENLVTRTEAGGRVSPTSTMVISVPADRLDSALDQLKSLGTITSRVLSSEDVTLQVADVDARIRTLTDSIGRLRDLWSHAGKISELTELENEIQTRIAERASLVSQQQVLAKRVAQSPITITLSTPEQIIQSEAPGFLGGLFAGWNALVSSSRTVMMVVGALLPFAVLIGIILAPVLWWRRRTRSPRPITAKVAAPAAAAPSGTDPVTSAADPATEGSPKVSQ